MIGFIACLTSERQVVSSENGEAFLLDALEHDKEKAHCNSK